MINIITKIHNAIVRNRHKRIAVRFSTSPKDLVFYPEDSVFTYSTISIGSNVFINRRAYFSGCITIGNNVLFGPDVFITSGDHEYREVGKLINSQGRVMPRKVVVEDDVWIGAKVCILAGVRIGQGAVIGAGSVVTKDIEPYTICVGNPCRKIKDRYVGDDLMQHVSAMNE